MPRLAVARPVFVDTGAWIALALTRAPLHDRALEAWSQLRQSGARL
jgi:predicted nucleic acid-binding protein